MLVFVLGLRQNMVVSLAAALLISIGSGLMGSGFEWLPMVTGLQNSGPVGDLLSGGGLLSMMNALLIILISSALSGLFELTRCLEPLLERVSRDLSNRGRLILSTGAVSLFVSLVSGNQTMTTLITGGYYGPKFDELNEDRRLLARTICDTGVVSVPLIPWNINGILVATVTGVSTMNYLPYALNSWVLPLLTLSLAILGMKSKPYAKKAQSSGALKDRI
jgi:NhaC family Na+:H+ antiporter